MKSKDNDKNFRFGAKYEDIRERIIENRREQSFPKTMKRQLIAICSVIVIFSLSIVLTLYSFGIVISIILGVTSV